MTYQTYSHQQLQQKSIAGLKQIYAQIGCTVEVTDKRCKDAWISAIAEYQANQIQKVAQHELNSYITTQAQIVAPEELRIVEISFYDHEYYAGDKLIAAINYDDNLTQPWVVMVDGVEKFRANTWARCHRFIQWHHQDSKLNDATPATTETPCTTENRIMAHIFSECQRYGLEVLDGGIYKDDLKLGEVGCTDGNWWVIQGSSNHQQYSDSVFDAVRRLCQSETSLCIGEVSTDTDEYWQYRPLEQLNSEELQELFEQAELVAV